MVILIIQHYLPILKSVILFTSAKSLFCHVTYSQFPGLGYGHTVLEAITLPASDFVQTKKVY